MDLKALGQNKYTGREDYIYALALEIEDLDACRGGSAEPVAVGGEDEGVDDVTGLEGVEVLALVEVPEHGNTILAAGGSERAVGRDRDGVDVAGVAVVVGLELELRELPNLRRAISTVSVNVSRHEPQ